MSKHLVALFLLAACDESGDDSCRVSWQATTVVCDADSSQSYIVDVDVGYDPVVYPVVLITGSIIDTESGEITESHDTYLGNPTWSADRDAWTVEADCRNTGPVVKYVFYWIDAG